jgi:hypothetical protein
MNVNSNQFIIIPIEELQRILNPIYSKLEIIENKIGKTKPVTTNYYRNKDLKQIFGLSDNTILKYRDKGILPYTFLDNIYYYPIERLNELLIENSNLALFNNVAS